MYAERIITPKDNNPPSDEQILHDKLKEKYADDLAEINNLAEREIPTEVNDDNAGQWTDFVKTIDTKLKGIEKIHTAEKAPYLAGGRIVDTFKNNQIAKLDPIKKKVLAVLNAHLDRKEQEEKKRLLAVAEEARQKAEALALAAELHAKADIQETAEELMDKAFRKDEQALAIQDYALSAPSSRLAKIRSEGGSSAARRTFWVAEFPSIAGLDLNEVKDFFKPEEIQSAYDRHVKANADRVELKGVKIYQKTELKGVR